MSWCVLKRELVPHADASNENALMINYRHCADSMQMHLKEGMQCTGIGIDRDDRTLDRLELLNLLVLPLRREVHDKTSAMASTAGA